MNLKEVQGLLFETGGCEYSQPCSVSKTQQFQSTNQQMARHNDYSLFDISEKGSYIEITKAQQKGGWQQLYDYKEGLF